MGAYRSTPTLVGLLFLLASLPFASAASAASPDVVISQVYGGGGNLNAVYQNDFVELFNRGSAAVNLSGWSVQYATIAGTTWQKTDLSGFTLQPGQYYLVQGASGAGCSSLPCGASLPTADTVGTLAMNSSGKLALVSSTTLFASGTACPVGDSSVRDFLGWGSTTCFEGANATAGSNFTSVVRFNHCADADDNLNEFELQTPVAHNTATALASCGGTPLTPTLTVDDVMHQETDAGTRTFSFTVSLSSAALAGGVSFDVTTNDGTATAPDDYQTKSLTGQLIPAGSTSYGFDVAVSGDAAFEDDESFTVQLNNVSGATVSDSTGLGTILNDDEDLAAPVVTSLTGPGDAVSVGTTQQFVATFTDENETDTHTTSWEWGDGSPATGHTATGSDSASHTYLSAGFYTVTFAVTDSSGLTDSDTVHVVVFDPNAGHVTGSGSLATGASIEVMAAYRQGGSTLLGSVTLAAPELSFASTSLSWLVTSGSAATFKGSGLFNGQDGYSFVMAVTDGGSPGTKDRVRFRVKDADGTVVYDTQPADSFDAAPTAQLTAGNLTVHKNNPLTAQKRGR